MPQIKNLHLHVDEGLLERVDSQAGVEHVSRNVMVERLLRDGLEARIHGNDIRSEFRAVIREDLTALLVRGARDSGIAWRMLYQLMEAIPDWQLDVRRMYDEALARSESVITEMTQEGGGG